MKMAAMMGGRQKAFAKTSHGIETIPQEPQVPFRGFAALSEIRQRRTERLNRTPRSLILLETERESFAPLATGRFRGPRFQWKLGSIETFRLIDYWLLRQGSTPDRTVRLWEEIAGVVSGGSLLFPNKWRKFAFWSELMRDWISNWCDWTTCRCGSFQLEVMGRLNGTS